MGRPLQHFCPFWPIVEALCTSLSSSGARRTDVGARAWPCEVAANCASALPRRPQAGPRIPEKDFFRALSCDSCHTWRRLAWEAFQWGPPCRMWSIGGLKGYGMHGSIFIAAWIHPSAARLEPLLDLSISSQSSGSPVTTGVL